MNKCITPSYVTDMTFSYLILIIYLSSIIMPHIVPHHFQYYYDNEQIWISEVEVTCPIL